MAKSLAIAQAVNSGLDMIYSSPSADYNDQQYEQTEVERKNS